MNCQMGTKSTALLLRFLLRSYPSNIDELRIHNVKGMGNIYQDEEGQIENYSCLGALVQQMTTPPQIKSLQLSQVNLNSPETIEGLVELIVAGSHMQELDISYS